MKVILFKDKCPHEGDKDNIQFLKFQNNELVKRAGIEFVFTFYQTKTGILYLWNTKKEKGMKYIERV